MKQQVRILRPANQLIEQHCDPRLNERPRPMRMDKTGHFWIWPPTAKARE